MSDERTPSEIIRLGVDAWNKWKATDGQTVTTYVEDYKVGYREVTSSPARLHHIRLDSADLRGIDLSDAWLDDVSLMLADVRDANFRGATLTDVSGYRVDLSGADFTAATLRGAHLPNACLAAATLVNAQFDRAHLEYADLSRIRGENVKLTNARLRGAKLQDASLQGASFFMTDLNGAKLAGADLSRADFRMANLNDADLTGANLEEARLESATLVRTKLASARLSRARVYGASVWDVTLDGAIQTSVIISPEDHASTVSVDNLPVAQFLYLLLNNQQIRAAIDTITAKAVLILGRFMPARHAVLEAMKTQLRLKGYIPILFDFEPSPRRDLTETVQLLANLSRFVIADLTDAASVPQELSHIIPHLPSVPVQPIQVTSMREYAMYEHWQRYPWVLPIARYTDEADLLARFLAVIAPAELLSAAPSDSQAMRARIADLERQLAARVNSA